MLCFPFLIRITETLILPYTSAEHFIFLDTPSKTIGNFENIHIIGLNVYMNHAEFVNNKQFT